MASPCKQEGIDAIADVLKRTREMVALPDNDFMWSSWEDTADALEEIDGFLAELSSGEPFSPYWLGFLYSPTGPIQEVSLSSGWGDQFLALADDFDAAVALCE